MGDVFRWGFLVEFLMNFFDGNEVFWWKWGFLVTIRFACGNEVFRWKWEVEWRWDHDGMLLERAKLWKPPKSATFVKFQQNPNKISRFFFQIYMTWQWNDIFIYFYDIKTRPDVFNDVSWQFSFLFLYLLDWGLIVTLKLCCAALNCSASNRRLIKLVGTVTLGKVSSGR